MRKKLFRSLALNSTVLLLIVSIVVTVILYNYYSSIEENHLKTQLLLASQGTELSGTDYLEEVKDSSIRLTWIDSDGTVLYDNKADASGMENHLKREEVEEALSAGEGESIRYSSTFGESTIYFAAKLEDGTVLRAAETRSSFFRVILGEIGPIIIIAAVLLILSFLLAEYLSRSMVKPINSLDLDHPLDNNTYEELEPLLKRMDQGIKDRSDAEQMRKEFSANVSHELKTPLQSIMGSAELLEAGLVAPEDVSRFGGRIRKESSRLVSLIDDIITVSKLDEGLDYEKTDVDMLELANEVRDSLSHKAEKMNVKVTVRGERYIFNGVPHLLYEMVYNVVENAIKYNVPEGKVDVTVSKGVINVSDTGIGIPAEEQPRVFERFYRVDKSHSKATGGTGLGLSIVKHAALYHDIDIKLDSSASGTSVTFNFPN